jgi:hypothetical protein
VEVGRFSFDGEQRVSPITSPEEPVALGIARYHQGNVEEIHGGTMYG